MPKASSSSSVRPSLSLSRPNPISFDVSSVDGDGDRDTRKDGRHRRPDAELVDRSEDGQILAKAHLHRASEVPRAQVPPDKLDGVSGPPHSRERAGEAIDLLDERRREGRVDARALVSFQRTVDHGLVAGRIRGPGHHSEWSEETCGRVEESRLGEDADKGGLVPQALHELGAGIEAHAHGGDPSVVGGIEVHGCPEVTQ